MIAQYDVFRNPDAPGATRFPFVVVLQSNVVDETTSVIVAPLVERPGRIRSERIQPVFEIGGRPHALILSDLASIPRRVLRDPVANVAEGRDRITAGLDLLFIGF